MDRLHEVIVDGDADRFAQRAFVLALRDHHHRHRGIDGADFREQLEAAAAGHLLVEQHDAVGLAAQQRERVVAVGGLRHGKALLFEEQTMGREPLDLVVDPENVFGTGHACLS